MPEQWIAIHDDLPTRGQAVWIYDSMMGSVIAWTVMCEPDRIDGDISHWMPRKSPTKPSPPIGGLVHAAGFPK